MKVAFIAQRYGLEINGGSELACRLTVEHMARHWDVEVITTCAIDYMTWKNEYKPGKDRVNGITVWRFPVDEERNVKIFNELSEKLYFNNNRKEDEINWVKSQGPYSTPMLDFFKEKKDYYNAFVFFTYLYGSTFFGLPLVREKAILVPTAHDEPPIHFGIYDELFNMPAGFIYLTHPEKEFVSNRFNGQCDGAVVGIGIDRPADINGARFCQKYNLGKNFLLYLGRIDPSKGCQELFDFFLRYKKESRSDVKLVLIGKPQMKIPSNEDIIPLGFVSEQDKFDALDASSLLVIPSLYESLSIATLEAYATETPVMANGKSLVLKDQCVRGNGGLYYTDYPEFFECLEFLLGKEEVLKKMGAKGKKYVEENYVWEEVEKKYKETFKSLKIRDSRLHSVPGKRKSVGFI